MTILPADIFALPVNLLLADYVNRLKMERGMFKKVFLVFVVGMFFGSAAQAQDNSGGYSKTDKLSARLHPAEISEAAYSVSGKFETTIRFLNRSGETRKIYWLDYKGKRKLYKELLAGHEHGLETYLTHPWLITDKNDVALAIYYPDTEARIIELN